MQLAAQKDFVHLDNLTPDEKPNEDELEEKQLEAIVRKALRQLKSQKEEQLFLL